MGRVGVDRQLAGWLVSQRGVLERGLSHRLGTAMPAAGTPEAEALRRLRSFVVLALAQDPEAQPSLEGLRVRERRLTPVLDAWLATVAAAAGPDGLGVTERIRPLVERFRGALRTTAPALRASGAPRPGKRRAVSAAIDRVADAFLAIDPDSGAIADANPAAGALLGTTRDALLGVEASRFVAEGNRERWWTELDALTESGEVRRFPSRLRDLQGRELEVEASVSRFATRSRTLALLMARPLA